MIFVTTAHFLTERLWKSTYTNSLPRWFHYQLKKIAARWALRDWSCPSGTPAGPECHYADRVLETARWLRRRNPQPADRGLRHLCPSSKCAKGRKLCRTSAATRPRRIRLTQCECDRYFPGPQESVDWQPACETLARCDNRPDALPAFCD